MSTPPEIKALLNKAITLISKSDNLTFNTGDSNPFELDLADDAEPSQKAFAVLWARLLALGEVIERQTASVLYHFAMEQEKPLLSLMTASASNLKIHGYRI